jgi:hypothetical protein
MKGIKQLGNYLRDSFVLNRPVTYPLSIIIFLAFWKQFGSTLFDIHSELSQFVYDH